MADEPTIEEVADAVMSLTSALAVYERPVEISHRGRAFSTDAIRTLLASHASLEERVKEAKRLMKPFIIFAQVADEEHPGEPGAEGVLDAFRALSTYVTNHEASDGK